jgi:hypothetical protein
VIVAAGNRAIEASLADATQTPIGDARTAFAC